MERSTDIFIALKKKTLATEIYDCTLRHLHFPRDGAPKPHNSIHLNDSSSDPPRMLRPPSATILGYNPTHRIGLALDHARPQAYRA